MIVIFSDVDGTITRIVNEEHWVQSDRNAHDIDVIFNQSFDNTEYNGYIQFLREGESQPSPKLIMTPKIITYGEGTFRGYSFRVQTEWHTAIAGTLKATIEIKQYEDTGLETNKAFGIVNIPIEEALSDNPEVESTITNEEYLALINAINAKLNIDDEKVYYFKNKTFPTNEDFVDVCRNHKSKNKTTNIYLGNVALNPTLAIISDNDEVVVISSTGEFYLYDQSNGERPLTMKYLQIEELTITKLLDVSQALLLCKAPTQINHAVNLGYLQTNYRDKTQTYSKDEAIPLGLIEVSEIDEETGEIAITYNSALLDINYDSDTGELVVTYI